MVRGIFAKHLIPKQPHTQIIKKVRDISAKDATHVVLFPGYGARLSSTKVNYYNLPDVKQMFHIASSHLGVDMFKFCHEPIKPEFGINLIEPAIYLSNLAHAQSIDGDVIRTAGFGVGELSALVFSGWLTFEEALRICIFRSNVIEDTSVRSASRQLMVRLHKNSDLKEAIRYANDFCKWKGIENSEICCSIATYLYPECKIIGGNQLAIQFIAHNREMFKLGPCKYLSTPCAINTRIIPKMRKLLKDLPNNRDCQSKQNITCYSTIEGKAISAWNQVKEIIINQASKAIKWEQILYSIYENNDTEHIPDTIFCGPQSDNIKILKLTNWPAYQKWYTNNLSIKEFKSFLYYNNGIIVLSNIPQQSTMIKP